MKTSSSSAASTLTYESDISARLNTHKSCEEAKLFDSLLKKLETVRINRTRDGSANNEGHRRAENEHRDDYVPREVRGRDNLEQRNNVIVDEGSLEEEKLPRAILKLDQRHAIPRPRVKNDVLVEIEVRFCCSWC